ncbi:MAG TPA: pantoate--beta-alanine ligase, partial [Anaerolineae bacterium]|nr:pantoate--beta-alanine ligase [Anaerolineae bacterium]
RDQALLRTLNVDILFAPPPDDMYPAGFNTYVNVGGVSERLEGAARPGHFRGVTTVVCKLFNLIRPDRAYFGQKDAQQLAVIHHMVRDLNIDVALVPCPIVREPDGLAMSSRNVYLNPAERKAATVLYRALQAARARWEAGERKGDALRDAMWTVLAMEPLARVEYVSVADADSLQELDRVEGPALVSLAVRIGRARLIDNVMLGRPFIIE